MNPFLRALYFIKRRRDLGLYKNLSCPQEGRAPQTEQRVGKVSLVIPWLIDLEDAKKLYGSHITKTGEDGKHQQEEWIRSYGINQCGMEGTCGSF